MNKKIYEACRERFATHKATLIQDTDRYLAIDWRKSNGSGDYYVNYILDKKRGSLIISGDLGDCIATWYNKLDAAKVKSYVNDVPYFMGKFQCASDDYTYEEGDVIADIREHFEEYDIDVTEVFGIEYGVFDVDDFWHAVEEEVSESTCRAGKFLPTNRLIKIMELVDYDFYEWLYSCGKRIHQRVYLWAVGFQMACDQLGL